MTKEFNTAGHAPQANCFRSHPPRQQWWRRRLCGVSRRIPHIVIPFVSSAAQADPRDRDNVIIYGFFSKSQKDTEGAASGKKKSRTLKFFRCCPKYFPLLNKTSKRHSGGASGLPKHLEEPAYGAFQHLI